VTTQTAAQSAWTLDAGATWHILASRQIVSGADGTLTLAPLPGKAWPFDLGKDAWPDARPVSIAGSFRRLFVLDARSAAINRISVSATKPPQAQGREHLETIGGRGSSPRQLLDPQGLAQLATGDLVVADTGNHRVQVFSAGSRALVHVWGRTDTLGRPIAGDGDRQFHHPWDVASDRHGVVYVVDRGNRRIQRIDRTGRSLGPLVAAGLGDPTRIAVSAEDGSVAVIDRARQAVWVFSSARRLPRLLEVDRPSALAFSPQNFLYVGDELGRIQVFAPDPSTGRWPLIGSGVTGVDGTVTALHWWQSESPRLLAVIENAETDARRLWMVDPAGGHVQSGGFVAGPLDSRIAECGWRRVLAEATIPDTASIGIDTFTADSGDATPPSFDEDDRPTGWVDAGVSTSAPDTLVRSAPGRYLWIRVMLRANGEQSPALRRLSISYPSSGYLDYLPAVFQEDDESRQFMERFLAIFQSGFDDLDRAIDGVTNLFDPYRTRAAYLRWLAAWLAVTLEPGWSELEQRQAISAAVHAYSRKGTVDGIQDALRAYAHVDARIVEHFKLRRWVRLAQAAPLDGTTPLWSRDIYQRYQTTSYSQVGVFHLTGQPEPVAEPLDWGASRFSVLFQADPYSEADMRARVSRVVEREKPAHTEAMLCPVFPRFRIGVQSTIGLDSAVGGVTRLVLNQLATLNYDAILGCAAPEGPRRALGPARRPRAGTTTRLA